MNTAKEETAMGMTDTLKTVYEKIPKGVKYAFGPIFMLCY